jgi:hypothetical protein
LKNLVDTLHPVRIATEQLSRQNINILTSEGILKFVFDELNEAQNELAQKLRDALLTKISDRRNDKLSTLILYLSNPNIYSQAETIPFPLASKTSVQKFAAELMTRLFGDDSEINNELEISNEIETESPSLHQKLKQAIQSVKTPRMKEKEKNFKTDFQFLDRYKDKTPNLIKLHDALSSVQPTSTQSERNFSLSGNIVSKLRNRLSDKHVDILCFLKSFFLNQ